MGNVLDRKAIQDEIKRLQDLLRLAEDPKFQENLKRFAKEAKGRTAKASTEQELIAKAAPIATQLPSSRPRGYVLRAVETAATSLPGSFTTDEIEKAMRDAGFVFQAAIPNIAINEALRTLAGRGIVKQAGRKGVQILWTAIRDVTGQASGTGNAGKVAGSVM